MIENTPIDARRRCCFIKGSSLIVWCFYPAFRLSRKQEQVWLFWNNMGPSKSRQRASSAAACRRGAKGWLGRKVRGLALGGSEIRTIGPGLSLRFYSVQRRSIANSN